MKNSLIRVSKLVHARQHSVGHDILPGNVQMHIASIEVTEKKLQYACQQQLMLLTSGPISIFPLSRTRGAA